MFCYNCGNKTVANGSFCMECGHAVTGIVVDSKPSGSVKTAKSSSVAKAGDPGRSRNKLVIFLIISLLVAAAGTGSYFAYKHFYPPVEVTMATPADDYSQSATLSEPAATETTTYVLDNATAEEPQESGLSLSNWLNQQKFNLQYYGRVYGGLLIYLLPALLGIVLALANFEWANTMTEKFEQWIRFHFQNTASSEKRFVRFVVRPMLALLVIFSNWTDNFSHRGWKNGLRLALFLYVIIFWVLAVVYGIVVVVMVLFMGFLMFFLLRQFSPGTIAFFQKLVDAWKRGAEIGRGGR